MAVSCSTFAATIGRSPPALVARAGVGTAATEEAPAAPVDGPADATAVVGAGVGAGAGGFVVGVGVDAEAGGGAARRAVWIGGGRGRGGWRRWEFDQSGDLRFIRQDSGMFCAQGGTGSVRGGGDIVSRPLATLVATNSTYTVPVATIPECTQTCPSTSNIILQKKSISKLLGNWGIYIHILYI